MISDRGAPFACSRCDAAAIVAPGTVGTPMHRCAGLGGMSVPFAPAGTASKVELNAREDYVGTDDVQRDADGRVWMSAVTTTDEGESLAVYAPCAHATIG